MKPANTKIRKPDMGHMFAEKKKEEKVIRN